MKTFKHSVSSVEGFAIVSVEGKIAEYFELSFRGGRGQHRILIPASDTSASSSSSRHWRREEVISVAKLGESLSSVLDGLEELGLEGVPASMEFDLRRAMNLHEPSPSPYQHRSFADADSPLPPQAQQQAPCSSPSCLEQQQQHLDLLPSEEELVEELFRAAEGGANLAAFVGATSSSSGAPYSPPPSPFASDRFQELWVELTSFASVTNSFLITGRRTPTSNCFERCLFSTYAVWQKYIFGVFD